MAARLLVSLLLALQASAAVRGMLQAPGPCVDARLLLDVLLAELPVSDGDGARPRLALLAYSPHHDVLCTAALARLHHNKSLSFQVHAMRGDQDNHDDDLKGPGNDADVIVLLLGSTGKALMVEAWWLIKEVMPRFTRTAPVLVVVVTGQAGLRSDAVLVQRELQHRKWWRGAIALQRHSGEAAPGQVAEATVFTSRVLFEPGVRCGKHWSRLKERAHWRPGSLRLRLKSTSQTGMLFPGSPRSSNLKGCVIIVAPMESAPYVMTTAQGLTGVDMSLVRYFARTKNVSLEMMPSRRLGTSTFTTTWEDKPENSTDVDPVDMLGMGIADLVIGGVFPTSQRYSTFELSGVYASDTVRCYLVRDHLVPRWQYPFAVLSAKTWAFLAFAMLCVGATLTWLNRQGAAANAMLLWGVLLEGRSFPDWMSTRTTLLVFLWIVFAMHFTAGYRASLAMANMGTLKRAGASNLQDVNETVRTVGMIDDMLVPFLRDDRQLAQLLGRVTLCRSMHNCSRLVRQHPYHVALLMGEHSMWFLSSRYFLDERGRPLLQPLREALYTFHVTTLVPKGSPILPALNDAIAHTQEGGLVPCWFSTLQMTVNLYIEASKRSAGSYPPPLGLQRIVGPFACLTAGLVVAFSVFVGEHLCYGGQKMAGLDPDDADGDADPVLRNASVDAPLQALKAEVEAEEAAAEAAAQIEGDVTTLLVKGTVTLAEGAGRYDRAACLETEVWAISSSPPVLLPEAPLDGVLERVDVLAATAAASLPEKEVHLGEGPGRFDRAAHLETEVMATMAAGEGVPGAEHGFGELLVEGQGVDERQNRYGTIWDDLDRTVLSHVPDVDAVFGAATSTP